MLTIVTKIPMGPYVREMIDAGMFFSNRVLKDFKEKYAMCDGQCFLVGGISCHWTFVGNQIVEWASPWLWLVLWVCVSVFAHSCFGDGEDTCPVINLCYFSPKVLFFAGKNVLLVNRGSFFHFRLLVCIFNFVSKNSDLRYWHHLNMTEIR